MDPSPRKLENSADAPLYRSEKEEKKLDSSI
jgi:hypothetical protein